MSLRSLLVTLLLLAASCFAADVDGKWTGTMATPNGDVPVNFTFKADGTALTGTTTGPAGEIKIADGKANGNNISFSITFDFGGMPPTINCKGVVAKEEIKFTLDIMGMPFDLNVKKAS